MENKTTVSIALLLLRLSLGITMLVHGLQKLGVQLGPGSSPSLADTIHKISGMFPEWLAYMSVAAEVLGGLGLILGLFGRVAAFGVAVNMLVAILKVHLPNGFFNADKGFEWQMSLVAIALALMLTGMGAYSIDAYLARRMDRTITKKNSST
jgi:putative oxidoreductase